MKRILSFFGAAAFVTVTLSSCGGFTGAVVPKEGAKNIRLAEFNHDYNNGWNTYEDQSLALPGKHIFVSKLSSKDRNQYILERYNDTLGKVWSHEFQNPDYNSQPRYFLADGMIKSLSYAQKKTELPAVVARVIDPATGTIVSTRELATPEAGQSEFITQLSADNSKILVANFEKKEATYNLLCRVFDSKFALLKTMTVPLEFTKDMIFLTGGDGLRRMGMVEGSISPKAVYENYSSLFDFTVTSGGEVLVIYAFPSNGGELIVKKGSTGEKIVAPLGMTGSQPDFYFSSLMLTETTDGKMLLAARNHRTEDDIALITAEFDTKNNQAIFFKSHVLNDELFKKMGVKDVNAIAARPQFIAPASDGGFLLVSEALTTLSGYSVIKQGDRNEGYYGYLLFSRVDKSGNLLWSKHIERTQFLNKGGYEKLLWLEASTHIAQIGDKLKVSYRDRDSDDGFTSYEVNVKSGEIRQYDIPFKFEGLYKGGVTYIRDLTQWVDENTLVLVGHEGQLGSTGKIIQITTAGK